METESSQKTDISREREENDEDKKFPKKPVGQKVTHIPEETKETFFVSSPFFIQFSSSFELMSPL